MLNNLRFKKAREQSGQSTVEYILLVTAVIGVMIVFLLRDGGPFKTKLSNTMNTTMSDMEDQAEKISSSHNTAGGSSGNSVVTVNVEVNLFP